MATMRSDNLSLRHAVATLAYRAAKALRRAPADFTEFRAGETSRSAGAVLAPMVDLLGWAVSQARGKQRWRNSKPSTWAADTERFFAALAAFDEYLASSETLHEPPEKIFQGAVADALTHTGQIAMLRRLAGARVRGENYFLANIETGRTGADQNKAVSEFN